MKDVGDDINCSEITVINCREGNFLGVVYLMPEKFNNVNESQKIREKKILLFLMKTEALANLKENDKAWSLINLYFETLYI